MDTAEAPAGVEPGSAGPPGGAAPPLVEMRGICKRFPGVQALDSVDFALRPGEIHGLLGENGAGKTTLMGVLGGLVRPDAGSLRVHGQPARLRAPRDALGLGIGMVHQHALTAERHSVLDNLVLGWPGLPLVPRRRALRQAVTDAIAGYGLDLAGSLDVPMHRLPVGTRQKVEIARALLHRARVLVLDEPTAVLTPEESAGLFALVREFAGQGNGVVLISHKLDEVLDLAHRITVLRRGRRVATHAAGAADIDAARLAQDMLGPSLDAPAENLALLDSAMMPGITAPPITAPPAPARAPAPRTAETAETARAEVLRLQAVDVAGDGPGGAGGLHGVHLVLAAGQVLGIAGVAGSGQHALAELLTGLRPPTAGTFTLLGRVRAGRACDPAAFAQGGVAHIPEDRHRSGVAGALSVAENLLLRRYRDFTRGGRLGGLILDRRRAHAFARAMIDEHDIRCPGPETRASQLSGGNLQKLIVARELDGAPRLIVAAYPFRGLDVHATRGVRDRLAAASARGAAVVLLGEELGLLFELADLIAVLFRGRLLGPAPPAALTPAIVGQWMGGHAVESLAPGARAGGRE
jgi:general nucleoside transport system ATP-binding protein